MLFFILSALGLLGLGLLIMLVGLGLLLVHVGVFILLPWSVEAKAVLAIILGLAYMVIGGLTLCSCMSEKTWMKQSGATEMLNDATGAAKQ
jgi:hypothetical protein